MREGNGVYDFVIDGDAELTYYDLQLGRRDAAGLSDAENVRLKARTDSHVLLIDVPMF